MRHRLWVIVSVALAAAGAVGLLFPAFVEGSGHQGFTEIVVSLLEPEATQRFFMRWIFFVTILIAFYVYTIDRLYRRVPLTVVRTKIFVNFKDGLGQRVETETEQLVRANRIGVAAYYSNHRPSAENGRVPKSGINHEIHCDGCGIVGDTKLLGDEKQGFEVLHMFKPDLPYAWYMPFIPIGLLNREYGTLPRFIKRNIVKRESKFIWLDEYNGDSPYLSFQAVNYSQMNIEFTLNFFESIPKEFKVRRIQSTGVLEIEPEKSVSRKTISFRIHKLVNERILITWENDRPVKLITATHPPSAPPTSDGEPPPHIS